MPDILTLLLEILTGWLVQSMAFLLGMHAFAKEKARFKRLLIGCLIITVVAFPIRAANLVTFGVHTLILLLIVNAVGFLIFKLNLNTTILSSIVIAVAIALSELLDMAVAMVVYPGVEFSQVIAQPRAMALAALPGNIALLLCTFLAYKLCTRRAKAASDAA